MTFPEWKRRFKAIMDSQDLLDEVLIIYLTDAIPKEYAYLLSAVETVQDAWERLEDRFGDLQSRILAIFEKLTSVELKGKDYERIERLYLEVEHAETLMKTAGSQHRFSQDMYIVSTLLSKLSTASNDRWNDFAEEQDTPVVKGVNEWDVFRVWLRKGYQLAKRNRVNNALPTRVTASYVPVKSAPAKVVCPRCRKVGHKLNDCPDDPQRGQAFAVEEGSEEELTDVEQAFATTEERVARYKKAERRFGKCKLCNMAHTYQRTFGNEKVEWPSGRLTSCPKFMAMSVKQRAELIESRKFCPRCTSWNHGKDGQCGLQGYPCEVTLSDGSKCTRDHDSSLHDSKNHYCDANAVFVEINAAEAQEARVLLAVQDIPVLTDAGMRPSRAFWDMGATICLFTHAWAEKMGLDGVPTPLYLKVVHHVHEAVESKK